MVGQHVEEIKCADMLGEYGFGFDPGVKRAVVVA